ncbi:hypothetical protein HGM15179_009690 [Zosterops borbonicus]|uniref:Uncharacterized protein n=1 Tax=Zosterops borbonicus TaxID=364589 RepID=A0A8K1GET2_9PASS|nr:hypothetical protein HGM15179_009690 [Zosterops borbonicus]
MDVTKLELEAVRNVTMCDSLVFPIKESQNGLERSTSSNPLSWAGTPFTRAGLIWHLIQNHPSGSGVNTGGANLSAAGSVDRLSKNLSGTRVGTWDAKSPPQAFYPEELQKAVPKLNADKIYWIVSALKKSSFKQKERKKEKRKEKRREEKRREEKRREEKRREKEKKKRKEKKRKEKKRKGNNVKFRVIFFAEF